MLNFLSQHFGHWIWYDAFSIKDASLLCEYEKLRFSIYSLNIVVIVALICILAWGASRREFRVGIVPEARQIIPWLAIGLGGWAFQYLCDLWSFRSGDHCDFMYVANLPSARYGSPFGSGVVNVAFFFAGSYLLQLKSRFHTDLREPTDAGIESKSVSRLLGNQWARGLFVVFELIALVSQFASPGGTGATWLDALGNSLSYISLGLGLLREMNRERREFVGMACGFSMLFYGLVQLTSIRNELAFDGRILAALLKFAFAFTMFSFGAMIKQNLLSREEERQDFTELLIALNSTLRHELERPFKGLPLKIGKLRKAVPALSKDVARVLAAISVARDFFKGWPDGLRTKHLNVSDFLTHLDFTVTQQSDAHSYEALVPPLFLSWAVNRLRENAWRAKAKNITVALDYGVNQRNRRMVVAHISNDGDRISPDVTLFEKPHGTWVARYLMQLAGGTVEREPSDSQPAIFRIELPAPDSVGTHDAKL